MRTDFNGLIESHLRGDRDLDNPKCIECNQCCGVNTSITKKEKLKIKRYLETNPHITLRVNKKIGEAFEGNSIDLTCPMTDPETKKCLIYSVRPETSRSYHCKKKLQKPGLDRHIKRCTSTIGEIFGFSEKDYLSLIERAMKGKK